MVTLAMEGIMRVAVALAIGLLCVVRCSQISSVPEKPEKGDKARATDEAMPAPNVDLTAALWVALGGFAFRVIVLLIGCVLPHRGKIRSEFADRGFGFELREPNGKGGFSNGEIRTVPFDWHILGVSNFHYGFTTDFFNERDVGVALGDVRVVLLTTGREIQYKGEFS